jgi:predicted Zn finger-like uncharacterized protein
MSSLLTQCPHCQTSFRVTAAQLEAAGGRVRCGSCLGIFSAPDNRITLKQPAMPPAPEAEAAPPEADVAVAATPDAPPSASATEPEAFEVNFSATLHYGPYDEAPAPQIDASIEPIPVAPLPEPEEYDFDVPLGDLDLDSERDDHSEPVSVAAEHVEAKPDAKTAAEVPVAAQVVAAQVKEKAELRRHIEDLDDGEALDPLSGDQGLDMFDDEPVTITSEPRRRPFVTAALVLANASLLLLLTLQLAQANVDRLARDARLARWLPSLCKVIDCPAPQRFRPGSLVSEQLLVRSHPRYARALEVSLVMRNDAPEAQTFPAIELGFSDSSQRPLANRLFMPAEYLSPELQRQPMPPNSTLQITLELLDPGSEAVNYTLAFREP